MFTHEWYVYTYVHVTRHTEISKKIKYLPCKQSFFFSVDICVLNCRRFTFDWNKILVFMKSSMKYLFTELLFLCRGSLKDVGDHTITYPFITLEDPNSCSAIHLPHDTLFLSLVFSPCRCSILTSFHYVYATSFRF